MKLRTLAAAAGLAVVITSTSAHAAFSDLFIFGDSISDAGNNATKLGPNAVTPVPIPDNTFVPTFPYASGHYTNGKIWAQSFAQALGLQANPALLGGTDFAFGGARTSGASPTPTLLEQLGLFSLGHATAPSSALYVVQGGGNNLRDSLDDILVNHADFATTLKNTSTTYAHDMEQMVAGLEAKGATNIVVWNVPDIGKAPSVTAFGQLPSFTATALAASMNSALEIALEHDSHVRIFDFFGTVDNAIAHPGQFGLTNVTDACAASKTCDPSKYLFWDGVHPTSAGHQILSQAMLGAVPEPSTYVVVLAGIFAVGLLMRRRVH
jgi:phospholipase/lecithinase/hemolysin